MPDHIVKDAHRTVQTDRRIDEDHLVEPEQTALPVQVGDKRGLSGAETVPDQMDSGNRHVISDVAHYQFHDPVQVAGIFPQVTGDTAARGTRDEVGMG